MSACTRDAHERFRGVFSAVNGCLACTLEDIAAQRRELEGQLAWLADWCRRILNTEPNHQIGRPGWPNTLVGVVARLVEERLRG